MELTNSSIIRRYSPPAKDLQAETLSQLLKLLLDVLMMELVQEEDTGRVTTERGKVDLVTVSAKTTYYKN